MCFFVKKKEEEVMMIGGFGTNVEVDEKQFLKRKQSVDKRVLKEWKWNLDLTQVERGNEES